MGGRADRGAETVDETVGPSRSGVGDVAARVLAAASGSGCTAVATSASSFQIARTYRPRWATIAGWVGSLGLLGLGLPFFFVRRTLVCTARIVDDHGGVRLHLVGRVDRPTLVALRGAVDAVPASEVGVFVGGAPASVAPVAAAPIDGLLPAPVVPGAAPAPGWEPPAWAASAGGEAGATVVRAAGVLGAGVLGAGPGTTLSFDTGEVVDVRGLVLVGRDPAAEATESADRLVAIDDPSRSVSKTHLAVGRDAHGLWLIDRGSTNGTVVRDPGGRTRPAPAFTRLDLEPGTVVVFGERSFTVGRP